MKFVRENMLNIKNHSTSLLLLLICSLLTACASDSKRIDYSTAQDTRQLEIPPDLSKITLDESLTVPKVDAKSQGIVGNTVSENNSLASTVEKSKNSSDKQNKATDLLNIAKNITIERNGESRWLRINNPPVDLWQKTVDFWLGQGFQLTLNQAEAGIIETDWGKQTGTLQQGGLRGALSKALGNLFDSGERVRYLTRIEKSTNSVLVYIAHQGIEEVATDPEKTQFRWIRQAANPTYEAKMLNLLAANLSGVNLNLAAKSETASEENQQETKELKEVLITKSDKAELIALINKPWQVAINDNFERAWLFTSLALDRGGFSIEEKDRSRGYFIIRYIDPLADQDKGFFQSLFRSDADKLKESRFRLELQNNDPKAAVLSATSLQQSSDSTTANRILKIIFDHLK